MAPGSRPELEPLAPGDDLRKGRIAEEPIMYRSFGCKMPIVPLRHLATKGQRGLAR